MLSAATEMRSILYPSLTLSLSLFFHPSRAHCYAPRSFSLYLPRHSSYPSSICSRLPRASARSSLRGFSPSPFSLELRVPFIPSYSHFHRRLFLFLSPLSFRPLVPIYLSLSVDAPVFHPPSLSSFPLRFHLTSPLVLAHRDSAISLSLPPVIPARLFALSLFVSLSGHPPHRRPASAEP